MKKGENMPKGKSGSRTPDTTIEELRSGGCNVYYEKSVTKNLGNYESAKVTVGVTIPISPTKEELSLIKSTLEDADNLVTDELEIQLKELVEDK